MQSITIAASLLSADFARLGEEAQSVLDAGADVLHFDVMDNHYVPNLTLGPMVCQSLRDFGITAPIDVHLMVKPVDRLIEGFAKAGATYISFHPDATDDINASIQLIKDKGCKPGLVLNPESPLSDALDYLNQIDMLLIMSVHPGFPGQKFLPEVLDKVKAAKQAISDSKRNIHLAIDGGIQVDNIHQATEAGADFIVTGSAIFETDDYKKTIDKMRSSA